MSLLRLCGSLFLSFLLCSFSLAQTQAPTTSAEPPSPTASSAVALGGTGPDVRVLRILKFSGELRDQMGRPRAGAIAVTFALYDQHEGSAPLWLETQNVSPDEQGRYSVLLGATRSEGVPLELFTSGEARWLGVQAENEPEQPRVLLVSVPYALKAADAETLGGRPASAYQLVEMTASTAGAEAAAPAAAGTTNAASGSAQQVITRLSALAGTGSQNFLAKWTDNAGTLGNSMIFDNGTFVGIGTSSPAWPLDLVGNFQMQSSIEPFFRLNNTAYSAFDVLSGGGGTAVYNNALTFFRRTGSGAAKVIFDPSVGNVGIGTNTPEALLTVGPGAALALGHQSDVTRPYLGFGTYWDGTKLRAEGGSFMSLSLRGTRWPTPPANTLTLGLYDGSGIITDNLLLIKGDRSFGINDGTVTNGAVSIRAGGTNQNITLTPSGTGNTVLNGNIGIGTPTPAQKLEVAGKIKISGDGNGVIYPDGTVQNTAAVPGGGGGDITAVNAGTGLAGGGTGGDVTLSLASTACPAGQAATALPLTCQPFATLGANSFIAPQSVTTAVPGAALFGWHTAASGANDGVAGASASTEGTGVAGLATASSGVTYGGFFATNSTSGTAVKGVAGAGSGPTHGGYFQTNGGPYATGVEGYASAGSGTTYGVVGTSDSTNGKGVYGVAGASSGDTIAGLFENHSTAGTGVYGVAFAESGTTDGVSGRSWSTSGSGVRGQAVATTGITYGGYFTSSSSTGHGVFGWATALSSPSNTWGVVGRSDSPTGIGVFGYEAATSGITYGVLGGTTSPDGWGVVGTGGTKGVHGQGTNYGVYGTSTSSGYGVYGVNLSSEGFGVYSDGNAYVTGRLGVVGNVGVGGDLGVSGNLSVAGTISKGGGSFRIDHPLEPATKYLSHSFVESPDMKNVYDGVVALDANGEAWVNLPEWFEALNSDFRYQLTAMGAPQPRLYIAQEISGNRFKIAGGRAGGRVSWQVTGIRQDAYARAHRIEVEEEKPAAERGYYLHPDVFGQPKEKNIEYARHPEWMREQGKNAVPASTASGGSR